MPLALFGIECGAIAGEWRECYGKKQKCLHTQMLRVEVEFKSRGKKHRLPNGRGSTTGACPLAYARGYNSEKRRTQSSPAREQGDQYFTASHGRGSVDSFVRPRNRAFAVSPCIPS